MFRRTLVVAVVTLLGLGHGLSVAQDGPGDLNQTSTESPASRPLILVEPGPTRPSTLYADGSVVDVESQIFTRLICGSDPTGVSVDDLRRTAQSARLAFENGSNIVVVVGDGPGGGGGQREGGPRSLLTVVFNLSSPPAGAITAFENVASYIEGVFEDPITITVNVNWQSLGSGILGQTSTPIQINVTWVSSRLGLVNGMDSDDFIQNWLPTGSTIPVRYNGSSGTITDENRCYFPLANYKATIGSLGGTDAYMTFNSDFTWDYDPSNGVGGMCFQSVAVHETGHAMGFMSGADFLNGDIYALDVYRFQRSDGTGDYNPDTIAEFQTTPRLVDFNNPNDSHNSNLFEPCDVDVEHRMSDGSPSQASHFRDQNPPIGIMDPTQANGQTFYPDFFRIPDIDMLDAIGWDYAIEGGATAVPLFDDFPSLVIDTSKWTGVEGAQILNLGLNEPSAPYSLNLDGSATGGDEVRSAEMDLSTLSEVTIEYYYQRTGGGNQPEPGEDLVVEAYTSNCAWVQVARHLGNGPAMGTYEFVSLVLTSPEIFHEDFRLRFRAISTSTGLDDWFVDDVSIWADVAAPLPNPMTWEVPPSPVSPTELTMTATEGIDNSPPIEYFFFWWGDGSGGNSSGWQLSRTYNDDGLSPNSVYTYQTRARDSLGNSGSYSFPAVTGATHIESPTGVTFGAVTDTSIAVTVDGTFTDLTLGQSGIYLEMVPAEGGGANVWAQNTSFNVGALTPGTSYTFRVKSRNVYGIEPASPWVGPFVQSTTGGISCAMPGDLNQDGQVNGPDIAGYLRAKLGLPGPPGENQDCADYGTGTLNGDTALFVADLLGP